MCSTGCLFITQIKARLINENEYVTIAVELQFKQLWSSPKKSFWGLQRDSNLWPFSIALQCSTSWAMKTHTWSAGQFIDTD